MATESLIGVCREVTHAGVNFRRCNRPAVWYWNLHGDAKLLCDEHVKLKQREPWTSLVAMERAVLRQI